MRGYGAGRSLKRFAAKQGNAVYAFAAAAVLLSAVLTVILSSKGAHGTVIGLACPAYTVLAGAREKAEPSASFALAPLSVHTEVRQAESVTVSSAVTPAIPRILIYHTHATEAYLMAEGDVYEPSGSWRTEDTQHNIVAIGALLKAELEQKYGVGVVHDTNNYEPPKLSSAYGRSLSAMEAYQKKYPTITVFIDVHRDAYGTNEDGTPKDYMKLDGKEVARLMCVVGTGEGATGGGFGELPDFEANHALAQKLTDRLREADDRLARDIRIKSGRYNQHVSDACLLVEVGHTANTLTQAKNAVPYLAEAIAAALRETEPPASVSAMSVWTPRS